MKPEDHAVVEEVRRRRTKVLALFFAMIGLALAVALAGGVSKLAGVLGVPAGVLDYLVFFGLAVLVGSAVYLWRCPRCASWLGLGSLFPPAFCPHCGVALKA